MQCSLSCSTGTAHSPIIYSVCCSEKVSMLYMMSGRCHQCQVTKRASSSHHLCLWCLESETMQNTVLHSFISDLDLANYKVTIFNSFIVYECPPLYVIIYFVHMCHSEFDLNTNVFGHYVSLYRM